MTTNSFASRFLEAIGYDISDIAVRAKKNKLPDWLSPDEIGRLTGDPKGWIGIRSELIDACERGVLKANAYRPNINPFYKPFDGYTKENYLFFLLRCYSVKGSSVDHTSWFIHRDSVRRYFQSLGVFPNEGEPLWHWLVGNNQTDKTRQQQDKADFKQLCVDEWKVSPTVPITGKKGMANRLRSGYFKRYAERTLERWAREVAPEAVKKRRGRPTKTKK